MKRLFDIIITGCLLCILFPLLCITTLFILFTMGRPIFFTQLRPGLNEKPFKLIKFRTMLNTLDARGQPLSDKQRLTKIGQFLRSTSVDELPELWNVLKGDMSLVGPRPLLMEYLPLYNTEQKMRHTVRPGITGWAQINGRNALSWEEKFKLDCWYVQNHSFILDLKILMMTIQKVLSRENITPSDNMTVEKFKGS